MRNSEIALLYIIKLLRIYKSHQAPWRQTAVRKKVLKMYAVYEMLEEEEQRVQHRRFWVRPIFTHERRLAQGASDNLVKEMILLDADKFFNYFRMTHETFFKLLQIVGPNIEKQFVVREPIPARTRLEVCLRYLASGDSMTSVSYPFRLGHNTVSKIVLETCSEIWNALKDTMFMDPEEENWLRTADEFNDKWNFPNCIGAVDRKHVILQAPPNSGSAFYNYKGSHSLNLMAVSDAKYQFILLDIGAPGRRSDGGVFRTSDIGQRLESSALSIPPPRRVSIDGPKLPFVLVADEAFPLTRYMMRPYPRNGNLNRSKKVFNYRLSRARRVVESSFGILAARMRIYRRPIIASVPTATRIIQATTCLHNFIMKHEAELPSTQRPYSTLTAHDRNLPSDGLREMTNIASNSHSVDAATIRKTYTEFFENSGSVSWQWEKVLRNEF